ncbi:MAG: hypothetical protein EPN91_00475 [Salinibacterium sp.]|nr:MAG: hypothetical protein EPN91_00475 [Salinibacterium sp.]
MSNPRWTDVDGMLHVAGGDVCACDDPCRDCGATTHYQPVYGGYVYICEACPNDAHHWKTTALPPHDDIGIITWLNRPTPVPHSSSDFSVPPKGDR